MPPSASVVYKIYSLRQHCIRGVIELKFLVKNLIYKIYFLDIKAGKNIFVNSTASTKVTGVNAKLQI
jgi:hypothetical protein